jgi:hypothetical protein
MAFIGGGTILKEGLSVRGTAAAIGLAVGFRTYDVAVVIAAATFLMLRLSKRQRSSGSAPWLLAWCGCLRYPLRSLRPPGRVCCGSRLCETASGGSCGAIICRNQRQIGSETLMSGTGTQLIC